MKVNTIKPPEKAVDDLFSGEVSSQEELSDDKDLPVADLGPSDAPGNEKWYRTLDKTVPFCPSDF